MSFVRKKREKKKNKNKRKGSYKKTRIAKAGERCCGSVHMQKLGLERLRPYEAEGQLNSDMTCVNLGVSTFNVLFKIPDFLSKN